MNFFPAPNAILTVILGNAVSIISLQLKRHLLLRHSLGRLGVNDTTGYMRHIAGCFFDGQADALLLLWDKYLGI